MRRLILPLALLALVLPASAQAAFTISTAGSHVSRLGPFHPDRDASVNAAIAAFGNPTHSGGRFVEWLNFGLRIRFENGLAQSFQVRSRRFRTWAGLRCGMPEQRIMDLHPAERHGHWWWLQRGRLHKKDKRLLAVLRAHVHGGRVDRMDGWIGAAG